MPRINNLMIIRSSFKLSVTVIMIIAAVIMMPAPAVLLRGLPPGCQAGVIRVIDCLGPSHSGGCPGQGPPAAAP